MKPNAQTQSPGRLGEYGGSSLKGASCCCGFLLLTWAIPLLFIFVYGVLPKVVCVIVLFMLFAGNIPLLFHDGEVVRSADSSGPVLSMAITVSFMLATASGLHTFYAYVQPLTSLQNMRSYSNVYPEQAGMAFTDAAYIQFADTTSVDVSRAASFKSLNMGFYTFCVAPIVDSQNAGRVEFWAVGVDCCGAAGDFQCDSAGEPGAQNGWVMRDVQDEILYSRLGQFLAPPETRRDLFQEATRKAEGLYDITSSREPVMVRWTNKSKDKLISEELWAIAASLGVSFISAGLLAIALTALYQRFTSHHTLHDRFARAAGEPYQPSIHTARILEFFRNTASTEKIALPPIKFVDVCLVSIVLPYMVLLSCLLLWSFVYCWSFGNLIMVPYLVLLFVLISVLFMTPQRCVQGTIVLLVSLVGSFIGCYNWDNNVHHYCSVESHRSYSNVFAEADALEYQDAGRLHFQKSARLSSNWSVGFKHDDITYCVAPVISTASCSQPSNFTTSKVEDTSEEEGITDGGSSEEATSLLELRSQTGRKRSGFMAKKQNSASLATLRSVHNNSFSCDPLVVWPSQIDFWAVGIDCCRSSGEFWCSDVKDTSASSAAVVHAYQGYGADNSNPWKQYQNAVRKAAHSFDLPLSDHPILVKWGRDVEELTYEWMSKAIGILLITSIAGLFVILAVAVISYFMEKQRQVENKKLLARQLEPNRGKNKPTVINSSDESSALESNEDVRNCPYSMVTKQGCFSFWQIVFVTVAGLGGIFVVFGIHFEDKWLLADASVLSFVGLYCIFFLGGDPCLLDSLRKRVNELSRQNMRLQTSNAEMNSKLVRLGKVTTDVDRLQNQLVGQTETAEDILTALAKLSMTDMVSRAVSHFFRADRSRDLCIDGKEAALFVSGFTLLKDLVPHFDYSRLQRVVRQHGLTLSEFSVLLRAIVADDPVGSRKVLEKLCFDKENQMRQAYGGGDINTRGVKTDSDDPSQPSAQVDDDMLFKPLVIGPIRIYGIEHFMYLSFFVAAGLLCIPNFMQLDLLNIGCALLTCALTGYLTFFGQMAVIVRALKTENGNFFAENDRLEALNDQLGSEIAKLALLQTGIEALRNKYKGNVETAQKSLEKRRANSVQLAVSAISELFVTADANNDHVIDEHEANQFFELLDQLFQGVPEFDIGKVKKYFSKNGNTISCEQLPGLVDVIIDQTKDN